MAARKCKSNNRKKTGRKAKYASCVVDICVWCWRKTNDERKPASTIMFHLKDIINDLLHSNGTGWAVCSVPNCLTTHNIYGRNICPFISFCSMFNACFIRLLYSLNGQPQFFIFFPFSILSLYSSFAFRYGSFLCPFICSQCFHIAWCVLALDKKKLWFEWAKSICKKKGKTNNNFNVKCIIV